MAAIRTKSRSIKPSTLWCTSPHFDGVGNPRDLPSAQSQATAFRRRQEDAKKRNNTPCQVSETQKTFSFWSNLKGSKLDTEQNGSK
jgi:hypothetical protein